MHNTLNDSPTILDIEASGFGRGSYPIEVGVILPDGKSYCHLICPEKDWQHWDQSAEKVHGIPRNILLEKGRPASEVANNLNTILEGMKVYSDAWGNDSSWLSLLFYYAGFPQSFKLHGLNELMSEQQMNSWANTREVVIKELGLVRHRASTDAKILQKTFLQSREKRYHH